MTDLVIDRGRVFQALGEATPRLTELLRSVSSPRAVAVGDWSTGDVASHLAHSFALHKGMVAGAGPPVPQLGDVAGYFEHHLFAHLERDCVLLAARIDELLLEFLDAARARPDEEPVPWYGGVPLSASSLACVLLGEVLVHGFDVGRAEKAPWDIPAHEARLLIDGLLPVLPMYVNEDAAHNLKATYALQVRGGSRAHLMFEGGRLTVDGPKERRIDCTISAEPVTFALLAYGRVGPHAAAARGKVIAWGRRPWLGLRFAKLFDTP